MKTINLVLIVTLFIVIFASASIVTAESINISATAQAFWDKTPTPGAIATITINFQSAQSTQLYLYRIGLHADWQDSGQYYTLSFADDPKIVEANGLYSTKVTITVPSTVAVGQHSFTVAVDGYDSSGNTFSWDSSSFTVNVASTASSPTPSSNSNGNGNSGTSAFSLDSLVIYVVVIAVVAVVAILVAVLFVKRKKKAVTTPVVSEPEPISSPPAESPKPEEKGPEQKPEEKDFTI